MYKAPTERLEPSDMTIPEDSATSQTSPVLTVDSVAFGGDGVARSDGKVFFVSNTVPGDIVQIEVTEDKGRYCHARVMDWVRPSESRGPSPCAHSSKCGGCQWQGISYELQLKWKLNFVTSAIARIGKLQTDDVSICQSPEFLNYRNRVHLKAVWHNDLKLGYYAERSHQLIAIDQCMIADRRLNHVLQELKERAPISERPIEFRFELQRIENKAEPDRCLLITVYPNERADTDAIRRIVDAWSTAPAVAWTGFMFEAKSAPYFVLENRDGLIYHTKPGVFQQVNLQANHRLRQHLFEMVTTTSPERILDLYSGSGNFSLALAYAGHFVEGSEFNRTSVECAKENLVANRIENAMYLPGDSVAHAWKVAKKRERFSHLIADPPREGLYKAVNPILEIGAEHIFYVSCDPTTLARDLGKLCRNRYRIKSLRAFDFFPNTYHVESVVHLVRQ
jgi:23S rRNA (uracil1939-C5)-methyltransferase